MYSVHVLFPGYSILDTANNTMRANCTCTLIKPAPGSGGKTIIIDTLTPWDGPTLLSALKDDHSISPSHVDFVVSSHGHSDHTGNNNLFLSATHVVGQSVAFKDVYQLHDFESDGPFTLDGDTVSVMATPGHTLDSVSVVVRGAKVEGQGESCLVVVAGDLFEREEDLEDENLWREVAGSEDPEKQKESRKKVLEMADWIVPGHGPMFKGKKI